MKFRVRTSQGTANVGDENLTLESSFGDLCKYISEKANIQPNNILVKSGYPPKTINPTNEGVKLAHLGLRDNEVLTVSPIVLDAEPEEVHKSKPEKLSKKQHSSGSGSGSGSARRGNIATMEEIKNEQEQNEKTKGNKGKEYRVEDSVGKMQMKREEMLDDNSCLFRAISFIIYGVQDYYLDMRQIVVSEIQKNPTVYTEVVLGSPPAKYCEWITRATSWGGAIELSIFSSYFEMEMVSIDIKTLRMDRFGEGKQYKKRAYVLYSGIHYDTIVVEPMSSAKLIRKQGSSVVGANISGFGVTSNTMALAQQKTVFDITGIDRVHQLVAELAKLIQNDFGYTDTAGFKIRCSICNKILYGEKDANAHMKESGHHQFEEIK